MRMNGLKWNKKQILFYFSYLGFLALIALIVMVLAGCSDDSYYNILGYEINEEPEPDYWKEDSLFFYGTYQDTTGT